MSNELTEWQEKADKILGLLKGDASTREQALSLLDSLADSIQSSNVGDIFASMFMDPNTVECTFAWMQDAMNDMSWSERRDFQKENVFWPFYDIMHRIYPKMAMEQHPVLGLALDSCSEYPGFLKQPNSVRDIVFLGNLNSDRDYMALCKDMHLLNGISSISFEDYEPLHQHHSEIDFESILAGEGDFRIVSEKWEDLKDVFMVQDIDGKRHVKVTKGLFYEENDFSLSEHQHLQMLPLFRYSVANISEIWGLTTPHSVLDLGIVRLYLEENVEDTIAERVISISLVSDMDDAWCDSDNNNYIDQLLGSATFPLLREVKGNFTKKWDEIPGEIKITADLLSRVPELRTIYFFAQTTDNWKVSFDGCENVCHPLSHVLVESNEDVIFYLFDTSNQSLRERLTAISVNATETLNSAQQRDFVSKASFVHLFRTDINISSVCHFTQLEALHVEREPYFVFKETDAMLEVDIDLEVYEINEFLEELEDQFAIPRVPTGKPTSGVIVQSLSEVRYYSERNIDFCVTTEFLESLKEQIGDQSFSSTFVTWLQRRGVVRVANYCLWVNGNDTVCMKAYTSWGVEYLDSMKVNGGRLNLERLMFGVPQGVQNFLPLSLQSIRYNDPSIPIADLFSISGLIELRVEISVDLEDVCILHDLEVLYLNDLGLRELPESIGELKQLRELHLWGNELTSLPDSIGQLENLRVIHLSGNPLESIPDALLSLPYLERVIWYDGTDLWTKALTENSFATERFENGDIVLYDLLNV